MSSGQRNRLSDSAFVYPKERKYPIHDLAHARAALRMAAQKGTSGEYRTVAAAVRKKYGNKIKTRTSS